MTRRRLGVSTTLWAGFLKRWFDILIAVPLLILISPILLLAAAFILVTSGSSVFFRQDRVGRHGRIFRAWKFRTMRAGRNADAVELVPLDHPEITPVGRFLRRWKIDELPQLTNVLAGHMSLVGPRPTLPEHVACYDDFRRQRLLVRPGITGLAQVNGNTAISWDERILYDIAYVQRCGFFLDAAIMLRTVVVLFLGESRTARRFADSLFAIHVPVPKNYYSSYDPGMGA